MKEDNKKRSSYKTKEDKEFCDRLFVYGTLQHGQSRNCILQDLEFEKAVLPNYRKVTPPSLGFPFILQDNSTEVKGEVYYGLTRELIKQIDMIEGEGSLYHRILVKVKTDDGKKLDAFTYYPLEILIKNYT